jgi:hypothetical protein
MVRNAWEHQDHCPGASGHTPGHPEQLQPGRFAALLGVPVTNVVLANLLAVFRSRAAAGDRPDSTKIWKLEFNIGGRRV